jgi:threonine synthase
MDVGNPSNAERLLDLHRDVEELRRIARACSASDEEIEHTIKEEFAESGEVFDPHTATAIFVRRTLASSHWVVVATAHPAKFESVVEPLVGRHLDVPSCLANLLEHPSRFEEIEPTFDSLAASLRAWKV